GARPVRQRQAPRRPDAAGAGGSRVSAYFLGVSPMSRFGSVLFLALAVLLGSSAHAREGAGTRTTIEEWQIKGIQAALNDPTPGVRQRAVRLLAELLAKSNGEGNEKVRRLARRNIPILVEFLRNPSGGAGPDAVKILGAIEAEEAVQALIRQLNEKVNRDAVKALGQLGMNQAVPRLITLLADEAEDQWVRGAAAEALGRIRTDDAVSPLIALLKDKNKHLREAAVKALGEIRAT